MTKITKAVAIGTARLNSEFQPANAGHRAHSANDQGERPDDHENDVGAALPIVRALPPGCLPFTVRGRELEPILREGDLVAVDVMDLSPEEDAFYLRRCNSVYKEDNLTVLAARLLKMKGNPQGSWWLGPRQRPGHIDWCDGPYSEQRLRESLLGRVVAIIDDQAPEAFEVDPEFSVRSQFVMVPL